VFPFVKEIFIAFVGNNPEISFPGKLGDGLQILSSEHGSAGVVGSIQQNHPAFWGDGFFQILHPKPEIILHTARHVHHPAVGESDLIRIGGKKGRRDEHLVSGLEDREKGHHKSLHGPHGNNDMAAGIDLHPVASAVFFGDGFPKGETAGNVGVMNVSASKSLCGSGFGTFRGVEIGAADFHVNDASALPFQLVGSR